RITEAVVAAYKEKTGLDDEEIRRMMDAETWMTAEEAVEKGFADEIEESRAVAASLRNGTLVVNGQEVNLSRFKNPPKLLVVPDNNDPPKPAPQAERGDSDAERQRRLKPQYFDPVRDEYQVNSDAERQRRLKLLALELELLTGSSF